MLKELLQLLQEVKTWPGAQITPDRNGLSFSLGSEPFGRVDWKGRVDVPLPADVRDRLVAERMAALDPDQPDAHRVVFAIGSTADVGWALWLLRLGYRRLEPTMPPRANEAAGVPELRGPTPWNTAIDLSVERATWIPTIAIHRSWLPTAAFPRPPRRRPRASP